MRTFSVAISFVIGCWLTVGCTSDEDPTDVVDQASTTITIGETTILSAADNGNANLLLAQQATLGQAATIQSLSFYVTSAAGNLRLGIYDATGAGGGPGGLRAQTSSFAAKPGWNTANVVTPVLLAAGTYWLAYLPDSNALAFVKGPDASGVASSQFHPFTFGPMPATFGTGNSATAYHWSFYATLTLATITIGETSVLPTADNGNANLLLAQQATLGQAAAIQSLSFYVTSAAGNLRLGIYDSTGAGGGPGVLKAQTNAFATRTGWNTASVVTPVVLAAGAYWLSYLPDNNSLGFVKSPVASGVASSKVKTPVTFAAMPDPYGAVSWTTTSHWSLYATLTPSSGGTTVATGGGTTVAPDSCTGPFSLQHQQPNQCLPYPNSLWNRPLPSSVMSHVMASSDSIMTALFTQDGKYPAYSTSSPWTRRQASNSVVGVTASGSDPQPAFYYGQATDPVYKVNHCGSASSGIHDPTGKTFHAPSGATYNNSGFDNYLNIWDQTTNLLLSTYSYSSSWLKLPVCPGNGHAGTANDPCPVDLGYCGMSNWTTDVGYGNVASDSLPNGGWATHMRVNEMLSGAIPHALFLVSDCMTGYVFPSTNQSITVCPSGVIHAPVGALIFLDYTPTQLADLKSKLPLWQYEILAALTVYGGYFGDASLDHYGGPSMPIPYRFEGPAAYNLAGVHYGLYDWLHSFPGYDPTNGDPSKPMACYTYGSFQGCDLNPYIAVPLETGPSCPNAPCDISKHMHIASECVALGLAGLPGGCN